MTTIEAQIKNRIHDIQNQIAQIARLDLWDIMERRIQSLEEERKELEAKLKSFEVS